MTDPDSMHLSPGGLPPLAHVARHLLRAGLRRRHAPWTIPSEHR